MKYKQYNQNNFDSYPVQTLRFKLELPLTGSAMKQVREINDKLFVRCYSKIFITLNRLK